MRPFCIMSFVEHIDIRSKEFEKLAWKASLQAIAESRALGLPVFVYFRELDLMFKELPNDTLWEVELFDDGTHRVIRQVEPPECWFDKLYPKVV